MSLLTIHCPECGYGQDVETARIPPRPVFATCPECRARFPFSDHLAPPPEPEIDFSFEEEIPPAAPPLAESGLPPLATPPVEIGLPRLPTPAAPPVSAPPPPLEATVTMRVTPGTPPPPEPPLAADDAEPPAYHQLPFVFTGTAGEYFRIWIVNLCLKIVTFGLYSAWAKVRKRRYFYGNTLLGDAPFDYTADPMAIFKGWCIGAAAFIIYSIGVRVNPILGGIFGLALFLAVPWVIVRSRMFTARTSNHRNVRFTFAPNYREAYVIFAGLPLLVFFSLGLIIPYLVYRQKKFFIDNGGYGTTPFVLTATVKDFYRLFLKVALGAFVVVAAVVGVAFSLGSDDQTFGPQIVALILLIPALYFFIVVYVQTELANLAWNSTRLGEETWFVSTLRTRDMAWLYFSNAIAIAGTLGLMIPWAEVRMARYRCSHLAADLPVDLKAHAAAAPDVGAGGEEFGDLFNIDVGM